MAEQALSINTRKALRLQLGETAGNELATLLDQLSARLTAVEQGKMDIVRIVPDEIVSKLRVVPRAA